MTQTNLIEKRKQLEQKKNRLKQLETSLNSQMRKKRTRKLIELGGLISKAKLEDWNSNSLFGALLSLKEKEHDAYQMDDWTYKGGAAFSDEKVSIPKSAVIVKFEEIPADELKLSLKSLGLKWNALRQEWEGYVVLIDLRSLLAPHKASIQELEEVKGSLED